MRSNNLQSVVVGICCSLVVIFLSTFPAHAIPFNIAVTGSTSLSNANLDVTGGDVNLTDGQTASIQIGTLSAISAVDALVIPNAVFTLNFEATSGGNSGLPIPASSASVGGTLFQFSIGVPNVLALVTLDSNPSSMTFDFDFGTLTLVVGNANAFSNDNPAPFNVSATFIAEDEPMSSISEPSTLAMLSLSLFILGYTLRPTKLHNSMR